ncbi:MAG: DUF1599 domain-containing protein [Chitinophagales bacterium]|nr:DUF1599 domain-containing protein [Chitinophagales bacterium]MDW8428751.1 DUF1599 domain-containing protein [Chitinophagales bacterium]
MENKTLQQFDAQAAKCRLIFLQKARDYGHSWRILRLSSLADQIFIKAQRIRTIDQLATQKIADDLITDYIGIVNYALMGLISLSVPADEQLSEQAILQHYDHHLNRARELMMAKNHDYGEAWRDMLLSSFSDIILMRVLRIRSLASQQGPITSSEGIDANLYDIINYAIFALIKISEQA